MAIYDNQGRVIADGSGQLRPESNYPSRNHNRNQSNHISPLDLTASIAAAQMIAAKETGEADIGWWDIIKTWFFVRVVVPAVLLFFVLLFLGACFGALYLLQPSSGPRVISTRLMSLEEKEALDKKENERHQYYRDHKGINAWEDLQNRKAGVRPQTYVQPRLNEHDPLCESITNNFIESWVDYGASHMSRASAIRLAEVVKKEWDKASCPHPSPQDLNERLHTYLVRTGQTRFYENNNNRR